MPGFCPVQGTKSRSFYCWSSLPVLNSQYWGQVHDWHQAKFEISYNYIVKQLLKTKEGGGRKEKNWGMGKGMEGGQIIKAALKSSKQSLVSLVLGFGLCKCMTSSYTICRRPLNRSANGLWMLQQSVCPIPIPHPHPIPTQPLHL